MHYCVSENISCPLKECPIGTLKYLVFPGLANQIFHRDYNEVHALVGSLFKLLSPLASKSEFSVKNPGHFLQLLKSVNLQSLDTLISFDVH
jgi:hypothetical protein